MSRAQTATSHDVARLAGVSQPTVSRALRDDARLSEETRRRVRDAAEQLRYVPSQRGRSLSTRSTGQIGIVVSDLGNSFYLEVLDELHERLREHGLRMLVLTPDGQDNLSVEQLADGSLDGAVLTTTLLGSTLPEELSLRGFPFVLLNREIDDCLGDVCMVDNRHGAALVARALLDLGHRDIAAVFGPENTSTGRDREAGFRAVLAEAGTPLPDHRWRRCAFDFDAGHRAAEELLEAGHQAGGGLLETRSEPPTAIFCANDIIALGALNALRSRGLEIPGQITVIGFDDVRMASWEVFKLTTVRQDIPALVQTATELLLARLASGPAALPPRRVVLAPTLVLRATHAPPPA